MRVVMKIISNNWSQTRPSQKNTPQCVDLLTRAWAISLVVCTTPTRRKSHRSKNQNCSGILKILKIGIFYNKTLTAHSHLMLCFFPTLIHSAYTKSCVLVNNFTDNNNPLPHWNVHCNCFNDSKSIYALNYFQIYGCDKEIWDTFPIQHFCNISLITP